MGREEQAVLLKKSALPQKSDNQSWHEVGTTGSMSFEAKPKKSDPRNTRKASSSNFVDRLFTNRNAAWPSRLLIDAVDGVAVRVRATPLPVKEAVTFDVEASLAATD